MNTEEQQVHKGATTERYQHGAWYRNTMCSETIMLERNAKSAQWQEKNKNALGTQKCIGN